MIATCRAVFEGGAFRGSEADRLAILHEAWQAGAELVDVEHAAWAAAPWVAAARGERLLVSAHDFGGVPADLGARHRAMLATGAEVVKIAVTARRLTDVLPLRTLAAGRRRQVLLAMGASGMVTRLLPDLFGSAWTYTGEAWAPGQIPAARLRDEFRFGTLSAHPAVYGVVARPSMHSVSPAMHNAAFAASGLDAVYVPLDAESAGDFLAFADAVGIRGASVTIPFKVDLLPLVAADDLARRAGAVNTVRRDAGGWVGTNTDVAGVLSPLAARLELQGLRAAVLGAGGAARAAALALADAGAQVTVHARRDAASGEVAAATGVAAAPMPPGPGSWDVLVNATPAGMFPDVEATPWPGARFDGRLVYDLVYNPQETRLLREARLAGLETVGGLDMLVAQARAQFTYWTGRQADGALMRAAAESRLRAFAAPHAAAPSSSLP